MFTFGKKLSVRGLAEETSHNLPLLFSEIIWEKQGRRAGAETQDGKENTMQRKCQQSFWPCNPHHHHLYPPTFMELFLPDNYQTRHSFGKVSIVKTKHCVR